MTTEGTFAKCRCQHCSGHIEFDAALLEAAADSVFGQTVECPHCKMDTVLYREPPAEPPVAIRLDATRPRRKLSAVKKFTLVAIILAGIIGTTLAYFIVKNVEAVAQVASGLIGVIFFAVVGGIAIMIALLWIIFPVFVYYGIRRLEAVLQKIEHHSHRVEYNTAKLVKYDSPEQE